MSNRSRLRSRPWPAILIAGFAIAAFALTLRPAPVPAAAGSSTSPRTAAATTPRATPTAQPTSRPTERPARPTSTPTPPTTVVNEDAGYWYQGPYTFKGEPGAFYSGCGDFVCAEIMRVRVDEADDAVTASVTGNPPMPFSGNGFEKRPIVLHGSGLDELRRQWLDLVPDGRVADLTIDGQPGFVGFDKRFEVWGIVPFGGRVYVVEPTGLVPDSQQLLAQFVQGIHFQMPACWFAPCPQAALASGASTILDFDPRKAKGGTWHEHGANLIDANDAGAARAWTVQCDTCMSAGVVVSVGTTTTGAPVFSPMGGSPIADGQFFGTAGSVRVAGTTLEELEASWDRNIGDAHFVPASLLGEPAILTTSHGDQAVLAIHDGYVIAILSWGLIAFDPFPSMVHGWFMQGLSFHG